MTENRGRIVLPSVLSTHPVRIFLDCILSDEQASSYHTDPLLSLVNTLKNCFKVAFMIYYQQTFGPCTYFVYLDAWESRKDFPGKKWL